MHKRAFFISVKSQAFNKESANPVHFAERLYFSKVDSYFNAPFNRSDSFVIAANPATFTCACCNFSELEKTLPGTINEKIAVTKWAGGCGDGGLLRTDK